MFINNKFYSIYSQRDLKVALAANGIDDYNALENMILEYHRQSIHAVEGLLGDDLYAVMTAFNNEIGDLRDEVANLRSSKRKNNTKADIANRIEDIASNLEDLTLSSEIYDTDTL